MDNLLWILIGISNAAIVWLAILNIKNKTLVKKLNEQINNKGECEFDFYTSKFKYIKLGLDGKLANLEFELIKQKAIIAELCNYVYKDK